MCKSSPAGCRRSRRLKVCDLEVNPRLYEISARKRMMHARRTAAFCARCGRGLRPGVLLPRTLSSCVRRYPKGHAAGAVRQPACALLRPGFLAFARNDRGSEERSRFLLRTRTGFLFPVVCTVFHKQKTTPLPRMSIGAMACCAVFTF